jgi:hypothetical protein
MRFEIGQDLSCEVVTQRDEAADVMQLVLTIQTPYGPWQLVGQTSGGTFRDTIVALRRKYGSKLHDFVAQRSPLLRLVRKG